MLSTTPYHIAFHVAREVGGLQTVFSSKKNINPFVHKSTPRGSKILKVFPLDLLGIRNKLLCLAALERVLKENGSF